MASILTLRGQGKGETCFVVGNGLSKLEYNISNLAHLGMILACNLAWKDHYVDILGFRDGNVLFECMRGFRGRMVTVQKAFDAGQTSGLPEDRIYWFVWAQGDKHPPGAFTRGSTGGVLLQLAGWMEFSRVVLVGMDCCALPGKQTSNVARADEMNRLKKKIERPGKEPVLTSHVLGTFLEQDTAIIAQLKSKGIEVVKLGDDGLIDVPAIKEGDL